MRFSVGDKIYEVYTRHATNKVYKEHSDGYTWYRYIDTPTTEINCITVVGIVSGVVQGRTVRTSDVNNYELGEAVFYHLEYDNGKVDIVDSIDLERWVNAEYNYFSSLETALSKNPGAKYEG